MEIDERLIKQLADMFSVQNQLAIEQDIDRRLDEIRDLFEELIGASHYKTNRYDSESGDRERRQYAYEKVSEKLFVIRARIDRIEEKIKNAKLAPKYKKAVDKEIEGIKRTYNSWKSKCKRALVDERAYNYYGDDYEYYIGRLEFEDQDDYGDEL